MRKDNVLPVSDVMILFNIVKLKTSLKSRRFNMSIHCTTCTKVVVNIAMAYSSIIKVLFTLRCFNETNRAGVAQCEARLTRNMEVVGSIPTSYAITVCDKKQRWFPKGNSLEQHRRSIYLALYFRCTIQVRFISGTGTWHI